MSRHLPTGFSPRASAFISPPPAPPYLPVYDVRLPSPPVMSIRRLIIFRQIFIFCGFIASSHSRHATQLTSHFVEMYTLRGRLMVLSILLACFDAHYHRRHYVFEISGRYDAGRRHRLMRLNMGPLLPPHSERQL